MARRLGAAAAALGFGGAMLSPARHTRPIARCPRRRSTTDDIRARFVLIVTDARALNEQVTIANTHRGDGAAFDCRPDRLHRGGSFTAAATEAVAAQRSVKVGLGRQVSADLLSMEQQMPDLYLTGTEHPFQIPGMAGAEAFEAALETYVDSISVMAIAEEMSLAGLARRKANESIAKRVADRKGLCHCYCDLDRDERQHHGIPSREEIELRFQRQPRQEIDRQLRLLLEDPRERHWLMRLEEFGRWPVLFICGEEHVCWFAAKVRDSGRSVEILTATWKP